MIKQLTLQGLRADLGAAERMLEGAIRAKDIIGELQFSEKVQALRAQIESLGSVPDTVARVALYFGGRPVLGSRGIDASFSSHAIQSFQTLLSKQFARRENGALGTRGMVAAMEESRMIVTDVARGSVGFVMEEAPEQSRTVSTGLDQVIDEVADALTKLSSDGDDWSEVLGGMDERVIKEMKEFFTILDDAGATLRIVEDGHDREISQIGIRRGRTRTDLTRFHETESELVPGQIVGFTSKTFEFVAETGERYAGRIADGPARQLEQAGVEQSIQRWMFAPIKVRFLIRAVTSGGWSRTYYTLISIDDGSSD